MIREVADNSDDIGEKHSHPARDASDWYQGWAASNDIPSDVAAPDDIRAELATAAIVGVREVIRGNMNGVYRVGLASGHDGYLKPQAGESAYLASDVFPEGTQWRREIAAYEVDRQIGLGLVPVTVPRHENGSPLHTEEMLGDGSLQLDAPQPGRPLSEYTATDRDAMAALDYVLGNADRHDLNYQTSPAGRPAAIDNGLCFPENPSAGIRSDWVASRLGKPLNTSLVEKFQRLDDKHLVDTLRFHGIGDDAISGVLSRIEEVRSGVITGKNWRGKIYNTESLSLTPENELH